MIRLPRLLPAALAAAGAAAALTYPGSRTTLQATYAACGEALLHGVAPSTGLSVSYHMPLGSLAAAWISGHGGDTARAVGSWLILAPLAVGLVVAGAALGGPGAGLTSLLLHAVSARGSPAIYSLYAALVLIALAAQFWFFRRPSLARGALFGAALGASLLLRSPLFLYGPLLLALALAGFRSFGGRTAAPGLALAAALPYLMLAPWLALNWVSHHRIVLFEDSQADCNIVTGALGIVPCVVGTWKELIPEGSTASSALQWALAEIGRHPLRYALSCAARAGYALAGHPFIFLAAFWTLWTGRRRPELMQAGFFLAYFIGVHSVMSLKYDYIVPAYAAAMAVAASGLWSWAGGRRPEPGSKADRAVWNAAAAAAALAGAAALACLWVVSSYAAAAARRSPSSRAAYADAARAAPGDGWILDHAGQAALAEGDLEQAHEYFREARAAAPFSKSAELHLAWTDHAQGRRGPLEAFDPGEDASDQFRAEALILQAAGHLRAGQAGRARERLSAALDRSRRRMMLHRQATERERAMAGSLRRGAAEDVIDAIDRSPLLRRPRERLALIAALADAQPYDGRLWATTAERASRAGDAALEKKARARARELLGKELPTPSAAPAEAPRPPAASPGARFESLDEKGIAAFLGADPGRLSAADALGAARRLRALKADARALPLYERLTGRSQDPALWSEQAEAAWTSGRRELALASARKAAAASLDAPTSRRMARLLSALGDRDSALRLLDRTAAAARAGADWVIRAELLAAAGDRRGAAQALAKAGERELSEEDAHAAALVHQALQDHAAAIRILEELCRRRPGNAAALSDLGLNRFLAGDRSGAVADLERALAADPRAAAAALTLGAVHTAARRPSEAAAVYERALKAGVADPGLRETLERALEEVRRGPPQ